MEQYLRSKLVNLYAVNLLMEKVVIFGLTNTLIG